MSESPEVSTMSQATKRTFLALLGAALAAAWPAARAQAPARRAQFIYVLRLPSRLHAQSAWTDKDNAAVSAHFRRLAQATEAGQVVLAGRSSEPLDKTFGIVIFEADNEEAARAFMNADPAVEAGVMTATLHPYSVALQRKHPATAP
jgi:uncharacterized protein YciI